MTSSVMTESWLEVGRVRSANARQREVRVVPVAGREYVFSDLGWIRFRQGGEEGLRCKVLRTRPDGEVLIVALGPGVSRDVVGQLRGARVVMTPDEMPPKPGSQVRLSDILGLKVLLPTGDPLGSIVEVFEGPANDAFAVDQGDGRRCILPVIEEVIMSVDVAGGTLEVGDIGPYVVEE